jgi:hypothetical protein
MRPPHARWLTLGAAAAITGAFFINFCATVFQCGCASLWNGADIHCNIHIAGARHCPWCSQGLVASVIPYAVIVAVQAAISFSRYPMPAGVRLASALAAFPLAGGLIALAAGLWTRYWR